MNRTESNRLVVQEILGVFYAPHRAFRKIVQDPRFLGPLIILVIFLVVQIGSSYVVASRSYLEQTVPTAAQGDTWTDSAAFWHGNTGVTVAENHADYINSSVLYFNTTSIEFTAPNSSGVQLFLNNFGESVDCGPDGFKNLSIRVKIVSPTSAPENVTLYLISLSPANYFAYDLTPDFSNTTILEQNLWNNITVPVGTTNWTNSNSAASWGNITGLRMDFAWPNSSNVDLRVDGLFFRGTFKSSLDVYGSTVLLSSALNAVTPFLFEWLLLTGLIWLLVKGLRGNAVWKPVMVAVGFALVTLVVQSVILLATYSTLSNLYYPLEIIADVPGESAVAYQTVNTAIAQILLIGSIVQVAVYVWIIGLDTFVVRYVTDVVPAASPLVPTTTETENAPVLTPQQFGWLKSLLVSAVSFVLAVTIMGFLGFG
jgi:hypothetical protein